MSVDDEFSLFVEEVIFEHDPLIKRRVREIFKNGYSSKSDDFGPTSEEGRKAEPGDHARFDPSVI